MKIILLMGACAADREAALLVLQAGLRDPYFTHRYPEAHRSPQEIYDWLSENATFPDRYTTVILTNSPYIPSWLTNQHEAGLLVAKYPHTYDDLPKEIDKQHLLVTGDWEAYEAYEATEGYAADRTLLAYKACNRYKELLSDDYMLNVALEEHNRIFSDLLEVQKAAEKEAAKQGDLLCSK